MKAEIYSALERAYWRSIYKQYRKMYDIDPSFSFRESIQVRLGGEGEIHLGAQGYIQNFSTIRSDEGTAVQIGEGCAIADHVRINTWQTSVDQPFVATAFKPRFDKGNVIIGKHCWLCTGAIINPGVTIGDQVVVGANAVVTHNLPSGTLCGGVPARVIRERKFI